MTQCPNKNNKEPRKNPKTNRISGVFCFYFSQLTCIIWWQSDEGLPAQRFQRSGSAVAKRRRRHRAARKVN